MKGYKLKTKGVFYVEEYEDQKVYGELVISDNSIQLESLGGLPDTVLLKEKKRDVMVFDNEPEYKKVFGQTNEGCVVLLKNHFGRSQNFKFLTETSEHFPIAFISEEDLVKNSDLEFSEVVITSALLNLFVAKSNIVQNHTIEGNKYKSLSVNVNLENKAFYSGTVNGKYDISFEPAYSFQLTGSDNLAYNDIPIKEFIRLIVRKRDGKINKDDLLDMVFKFKDFFAFGLDKPIYLTEVVARNLSSEAVSLRPNWDSKYLNTQIALVEKYSDEDIKSNAYDALFRLPLIEDKFEVYMGDWINLRETYPVLYDNYFETLYNPNVLFESAFLKLFIGVQEYFKKNKGILKSITLDNADIQYIDQNKEKNETILKDLIVARKSLVDPLQEKISLDDVRLMKDVRNGIAHGELSSTDYKNIKMNFLYKKLLWICQHCLMRASGFDNETLEETFSSRHF